MACSTNNAPAKIDLALLTKQLQSGNTISRETPFKVRPFVPFLKGKWIGEAISYGGYRKGQSPGVKGPSAAEVLEDLLIISKHWNMIRIYGSDDDAERILQVITEHKLPIRVVLGVWLENETTHPERKSANIEQIVKCIQLANQFRWVVLAVNVGNEAQVFWSWHKMQMENLVRYIRFVRNNVPVPVTTADDYNFWNKPESRKVAREIDFIIAHMYALWNGKTLKNAISWTDSTFRDIQKRYPQKTIVLGETGWATKYNPEAKGPGQQGTLIKGEVGFDGQEQFLTALSQWVNKSRVTTFLFEAFDEPWKGGGDASNPNEIEKHWGVFNEDRTPKQSFLSYLKHIRDKSN